MLNAKNIENMYFQKLSKYKQMIDGKTISAHFNIQKTVFPHLQMERCYNFYIHLAVFMSFLQPRSGM